MRVAVQKNIDIIRRVLRRNVLQAEFQTVAHKIDDKRPLEIAVAISAHNYELRADRSQLVQNRFRANVPKMPGLIGILRDLPHPLWQTIVCVGENENTQSLFGFCVRCHVCLSSFQVAKP